VDERVKIVQREKRLIMQEIYDGIIESNLDDLDQQAIASIWDFSL